MFEKNILIKGKHATYMKALVANVDSNVGTGIFKRNLDVYLMAPIVGRLYGRKALPDDSNDSTSIHTEQLLAETDELEANFRTIILLEDRDVVDINKRVEQSFKYDRDVEKRKPYDEIMEQYILGGIEVMYEKILEDANDTDKVIMNLFEFVMDFYDKFGKEIDFDALEVLCQKSSK